MPSVAASLVALALVAAPDAKGADCANAANRHIAAAAKVIEALRVFEKCITADDKHNDCTDEFEVLDTAHDDFVDAVDDLKTCK